MNIPVNDSRQLRIHTYVLWLGIIVMVAYSLFSKQPAISTKIHMQMKPSSTYHALSIQLNNTPNFVKICSVVLAIQHIVFFRVAGLLETLRQLIDSSQSSMHHVDCTVNENTNVNILFHFRKELDTCVECKPNSISSTLETSLREAR